MIKLTDKVYIIDNIINTILKYNITLEYKNNIFNQYYNIKDILDIVLNFLKQYDYNMYNSLLNMIDNKKIKFLSKEIYREEENSFNNNSKEITIVLNNTLKDAYSIIHEFTHQYYLSSNKIVNEELLEIIPICMESKLNDYLKNINIINDDNYDYIYNRIINTGIDCLYLEYIYLIKNNPRVMLLRNINKKLYLNKVNELLNNLGEEKKNIILKYQEKFEKQIDNNGFYHFDLDYRFRYIFALYYIPYIKDNQTIINNINNSIINKDNFIELNLNDCNEEFDKFISKCTNLKQISPYNIQEIESYINDMINIFNKNNISFENSLNKKVYNKELNINKTYNIVLEFLEYFDPTLKEAFLNIRNNDKNKFKFLSKDTEPYDDIYHSCVKYDKDGEINIVINNNIKDVFETIHEFIHYIYYEKDFDISVNFNNFIEFGTLSIEYYIWDYLKKYTEYGSEADTYMINRLNSNIINCYLIKYRFFYITLLEKYKYKDKIQEIIDDEINKLPDNIKNNFINNRELYYVNIDCYTDNISEIKNDISYSFRYIYASLIAPYIYEISDKKLFNKISRMCFNTDNNLIVDNKLLYEYYNKYLRLFSGLNNDKINSYSK